jgi:hypothetical protein
VEDAIAEAVVAYDAIVKERDGLLQLANERSLFIINGVDLGFISLPYSGDPALGTYRRCKLVDSSAYAASLLLHDAALLRRFANSREKALDSISLGHENRSRGASTYNWESHFCMEIAREASRIEQAAALEGEGDD